MPRRTAFIGAAAAAACLATGAPAVALQPGVTPHQRAVDGSFFNTAPEPAERGTVCIVGDGVERSPDTEDALLDRIPLRGVRPTGDRGGTGTQVASLLTGRRNGWGVTGLTRAITVLSVVPWNRRPASEQTAANLVANAIRGCASTEHPVRSILLLPFGRSRIDQSGLQSAVHEARTAEISVVAPSGEDQLSLFRWPADIRGVLTVGADAGDACGFPNSRAPLLVPACGITVPTPQGGTRRVGSGSLLAAPLVAGTLAALRSYAPELSRRAAEDLVRQSAVGATGGGPRRLSARRAFDAAGLSSLTQEQLTPSSARLRRPAKPRVRRVQTKGRQAEVTFRLPRGASVVWPVGEDVTPRNRLTVVLPRSTFTRQVLARVRTKAGVIGPGVWVRIPGLG